MNAIAPLLCLLIGPPADTPPAAGEELFVRRVLPLIQEKCIACHGGDRDKIEGGLDLTTRAGTIRGGDSGEPALVPGESDKSPLWRAVTRTDDTFSAMPPKEAEKLTPEQQTWLKDWIAAGAPWPDPDRRAKIAAQFADKWSAEDGLLVQTSGGLAQEWTDRKYAPEGLWAYQTVRKPEVTNADLHPIDELLARQMPAELTPAPRADRATLLRRVTFDLTGLPPTPDDVEDFLHDPRPDPAAFAAVVERLLASPHYGERMAQHWLDVVRYADSSGFANDYERGNAWRYRDYVVRAFNSDKRFNRFIVEQIAGDELFPDNPEAIIATGFLRMGPWELTGMEVAKVARQRFLDDVTNSVGETFLAHSLQCARCHDHKFDPVPTRDYYAIQAVFATTQLAERPAPFLPEENTAGFEERKYLEHRRAHFQSILNDLDQVLLDNAQTWFHEQKIDPAPWNDAVAKIQSQPAARGVFNAARNQLQKAGVPEDQFPPKLVGFTPQQFGLERVARKGLERLRWELDRYEPFALAVYNGRTPDVRSVNAPVRIPRDPWAAGELEKSHILGGGDPFSPTQPVLPGVLSLLADFTLQTSVVPSGDAHSQLKTDVISSEREWRRLAFAGWVADPRNPLTTRAIVNRIWMWHFSTPLAGNPNNFGSTGKPPTHPELLDWLAAALVEDDWSLKSLHRRILSSDAYSRSSLHPDPEQLRTADPLGTSYAVFTPRRLSGEEIRDAMLVATGELNPTLGGIPCRPEINLEVALQPRQVMGTFATAWTPNPEPEQRHRRSIYILKLRGVSVPLLEVFNAPSPDFSCERRELSTVTPQVFALFNGRETHARALALAHRALQAAENDRQAITRCFEFALARQPTDAEIALCLQHWNATEADLPPEPPPTATPPLSITRDAVEENTGERFSFEETLYSNGDFIPDRQPADVDRRTRALAEVCLALFNSNEFVYVD